MIETAIALTMIFGAAGLLFSTLSAISNTGTSSTEAQRAAWASEVRRLIPTALPGGGDWSRADSAIAASGAPVSAGPDTVAARALVAVTSDASVAAESVWRAFETLPGRLPDGLRRALTAAADAPPLAVWRRVALSGPYQAIWYSVDSADASRFVNVQRRRLGVVVRLGVSNAGAAALAVERRDMAGAAARAREIVAMGRQLWNHPLPEVHQQGVGLVTLAAQVMTEIALLTADRTLARQASALRGIVEARQRIGREFGVVRMASLATAPEGGEMAAFAGDRRLAPTDRYALLQALALGVCGNPGEVRGGPSPERYRTVDNAADRMQDIGPSRAWHAEQRAYLDQIRAASLLRGESESFLLVWAKPTVRSIICSGFRRPQRDDQ